MLSLIDTHYFFKQSALTAYSYKRWSLKTV
jgi:hypothetical protein